MPTLTRVYGDSHAKFFLNNQRFLYERLGFGSPESLPISVEGQAINAASVAGFRPGKSTLRTKETIAAGIEEADRVVLAFGQVDLELGYYYRKVVKREPDLDTVAYPARLVDIYFDFIDSIGIESHRLAIKGVNLTVLTERLFTERYARRIVLKDVEGRGLRRNLRLSILSEQEQNTMSLRYNDLLRAECECRGISYFDINDLIARPDDDGEVASIDPRYCPAEPDHHLVDSLDVRMMHIEALSQLP